MPSPHLLLAAILAAAPGDAAPELRPMPLDQVRIEGGVLAARQKVNRARTLEHVWQQCRDTGRIANFTRATGNEPPGGHRGLLFDDSDVYKLMEGAVYVLAQKNDDYVDIELDMLANTVIKAQRPDGYINTYFTLARPEDAWTDLAHGHEMYCLGHLIEAGVAQYALLGKRPLYQAASRAADLVNRLYGPGSKTAGVPGHEEIELALMRLYEVTGNEAHRALAEHLVNSRGHHEGRASQGEYAQDHLPLREQREVVGHAVRAMYLYTAATRIAIEKRRAGEPDAALEAALRALWTDLVDTKMYITGGIGSSGSNEGFTTAYDLPNEGAYAETCAAIGLVYWAHQMNLLTGEAAYADVLERALHNAVLSGVSLSGDRFFYSNPLGSRTGAEREPWFACACCPPNILRTIASLNQYLAASADDTLYINQYAGFSTTFSHRRTASYIDVDTDYPDSGDVLVKVNAVSPGRFTVALRIPGWCREHAILVNDKPFEAPVENGYARIDREWRPDDTIRLRLEMPVERVTAPPQVTSCEGRFALMRGPVVYVVEGHDSAADLRRLVFSPEADVTVERRDDLLGGVTVLRSTARRPAAADEADEAGDTVPFAAVPYAVWANRGPAPMVAWLPTEVRHTDMAANSNCLPSASYCGARDSLEALCDGRGAETLGDAPQPRFTWWPRKSATEWVQYDFPGPRRLAGAAVDWFDDRAEGGGCAVPQSWTLSGRRDGEEGWTTLAAGEPDDHARRTTIVFDPVSVTALRLEAVLREGYSGGILEWSLDEPGS